MAMSMLRRRLGKKQAKQDKDGDPSMEFVDDEITNIQIIIPSNPVLQDASAAATLHDKSSKRKQLHADAVSDRWDPSVFDKIGDMVRVPLTTNGDTVLHVAVSANSTTFVQKLVNSEYMVPEDLEITNSDGNTAFCVAALSGNSGCIQCMLEKNKNLAHKKREHDGMLPIHLAALIGCEEIVRYLSSDELLEKMAPEEIERLFFMTISNRMFDFAMKLVEKYPAMLAIARDDQQKLTALHMLARMPSSQQDTKDNKNQKASSQSVNEFQLLEKLWYHTRQLGYNTTLDLVTKPLATNQKKIVLFDAVKSGNIDVVTLFLRTNRELLARKDSDGRNLLHLAAMYRQKDIFDLVLKIGTSKLLIKSLDNDSNNVLHLAAHQFEGASSSSKPSYSQMRHDVSWFKEVQKRVPPELMTMRNNEDKTPKDIFYANHQDLLKDVKDEAKGIANSGMVVAALIAAVVFAAALTVPGDKSDRWFDVFFVTNAVALFTASASIIYFLAIFTSSWSRENKFFVSLLPRLNIRYALILLCVSVVSMIIAFIAASFLVYDDRSKVVAFVVASIGTVLPICSLIPLMSTLFNCLYLSSWSSL